MAHDVRVVDAIVERWMDRSVLASGGLPFKQASARDLLDALSEAGFVVVESGWGAQTVQVAVDAQREADQERRRRRHVEAREDDVTDPQWWMKAETKDGLEVLIVGGDPHLSKDTSVYVDGVLREVRRVDRMRDGGTTIIHTTTGVLTLPNRIGSEDRTPRWKPGG